MAKWIDTLARRLGYAPARAGRRDFAAAQLTRLTGGWSAANLSANADLYRALDTLRGRSRDLCNNNDYAKRFLGMVGANLIGTGMTLQARIYDQPGRPDNAANDAVEAAWARWSRRGVCEISGRLSLRDLTLLLARTVARDGEALVRKITGTAAGNPFGLALQLLDIDRLDTRLIRPAEAGHNAIRMGVEIDTYGRAVAYWLRGYHPGDTYGVAAGAVQAAHLRVPAAEILHLYTADRPEQVRGLPWMHAAMTRLNNLGGYEEAAVIAARVGASKMGFFTTPDGAPPADGEDGDGVPYMEADAGSFGVLPQGMDFKPFDPDYPHAMYGDFTRACLRGIASGLGVSYHALASDLTDVNFSSIRSGTLEERDQWITLQEWFKDAFLEPVFAAWLDLALAMGQVTLASGKALPLDKREKYAGHTFQARRWSWVDPKKDMEAKILAIQHGLQSPQSVAAELGVDYEDVLVEIKRAQELAAKLDVKLGAPAAPAPAAADPAVADMAKALLARSLDAQPVAPSVVVNQAPMTINTPAVRNEITVQPAAVSAPPIHNEITVQPAPLHVAAPEIRNIIEVEPTPVTLEATIAAPPPEVTINMPARRTEGTVERDGAGNIVRTVTVEVDA